MATTSKMIDANRRNAQLSTGPKSPAGKLVSSMNALKFGLWSKQAVLADEDPDLFDDFARRIQADLRPVGAVELALTDLITAKLWRWGRVVRIEAGLVRMYQHYQGVDGGVAVSFAHDASQLCCFERLSRCETSLERGTFRALAELKRLQFVRLAQETPDDLTLLKVNSVNPGGGLPLTATDHARTVQEESRPRLWHNKRFAWIAGLSRGFFHRVSKAVMFVT